MLRAGFPSRHQELDSFCVKAIELKTCQVSMQAGVSMGEASRFLGMTQETLESVYGHHHPDHLRGAATAISFSRRVSLTVSLTARDRAPSDASQSVEKIGGPAWTRTRNQTVMSADDMSNDIENADEFGSFDRDF
jgi:hypothetical protein